jgi:hypothetical protein
MLGLSQPVNVVEATHDAHEELSAEPNVTVLVEAPLMDQHESDEPAGSTCVADMELQTADTQKLERITDEPDDVPPSQDAQFQDTVEVEPADSAPLQTYEPPAFQATVEVEPPDHSAEVVTSPTIETEKPQYSQFAETTETFTPPVETVRSSDDGLLELDDDFEETISDDVSLDLDFGAPLPSAVSESSAPAPHAHAGLIAAETRTETEAVALLPKPSAVQSEALAIAPETQDAQQDVASAGTLSDKAIEAIARRVVEQMSDRVVREIAWEVVPELSELLIKKKLDEQK